MKKNKLKNSTKFILFSVFRWLVPPCFWLYRWLKDQYFLVNLQSPTLTPSLLAYPVWLILSGLKFIKKNWDTVFRDYGMQRYSKWIGEHYNPMGRGYFNYGRLSDKEKLDLYGEPRGRVENFLNNYSRTLKYEDGQSFLDAGCGRGQNIKVLEEHFPNSTIRGFDISEEALSVVKLGIQNQKQFHLEVGSLTDLNYMNQFSRNNFNHVLVSHVFSVIMSGGEASTHQLRQQIIDKLIRISSKTLLIIDGPGLLHFKEPSFEVEQLQRAVYAESIIRYFNKHLNHGEVSAIFSPESFGVLFQKN